MDDEPDTVYTTDRKFYRLDDICPVVPSGSGFYGSLVGAGYLAALLVGAVSAIWLQGWLG